jgi:hypothetical protein
MGGLNGDALRARARAWVERTCAAQGLPVKVEDASTLARVAGLLVSGSQTRQTGSTRRSSKAVRPGTARATMARSSNAATTARWRESGKVGQSSRSVEEAPT